MPWASGKCYVENHNSNERLRVDSVTTNQHSRSIWEKRDWSKIQCWSVVWLYNG